MQPCRVRPDLQPNLHLVSWIVDEALPWDVGAILQELHAEVPTLETRILAQAHAPSFEA